MVEHPAAGSLFRVGDKKIKRYYGKDSMKKIILLFGFVMLAGCTTSDYEGSRVNYLEHPKYLIQDPHFDDYKTKRDALESQYLNKEISYADYVKQRDGLDLQYDREVNKREAIIQGQPTERQGEPSQPAQPLP